MIWKQKFTLEDLNRFNQNTMGEHMGLEFTDFGDDYIEATLPVDHRNVQPQRILHGGASVALAETLGSVAANLCLSDMTKEASVGVEINANHLSAARSGKVTGRVTPIRVGRNIQVWQIHIRDERDKPICISRLTTTTIKI